METLLVDIGNTHLKWAVLSGGSRSETRNVGYRHQALDGLLTRCWEGLAAPRRILVASVASEQTNAALASWTRSRWSVAPSFLDAAARGLGVRNGYRQPATLGIDRWLGMIAVRRQDGLPVLIVDCGTAITLDLLDVEGAHRGGLILPGLEMMHRALFAGTSIAPRSLPEAAGQLGTDTAEAIASGSARAVCALIEQVADDFSLPGRSEPRVVLTGSDSPRLQPLLRRPARCEPDLIMQGLTLVAEQGGET